MTIIRRLFAIKEYPLRGVPLYKFFNDGNAHV